MSTPPSSPELVRDALMPLAPSAKVDGHPLALDAGADTGALLRCIREQQSELLFLKSELAKSDEAHWAVQRVRQLEEELSDVQAGLAQAMEELKEEYELEQEDRLAAYTEVKTKLAAAESANKQLAFELEGAAKRQAQLKYDIQCYKSYAEQIYATGVKEFEQLREHACREWEALLLQKNELQGQRDQLASVLQDPQALVALQSYGALVAQGVGSQVEQPADPIEMDWEIEDPPPIVPATPFAPPVEPSFAPRLPASVPAQYGPGLTGLPVPPIPAPSPMAPDAFSCFATEPPGGAVNGGVGSSGSATGGTAAPPQGATRNFSQLSDRSGVKKRLEARKKAYGRL
ncbi:hypothetical protein BMF94_4486 [Rhodotorula taiwanensis]|uniref:Uncharacterized protein n=1 Tax=Rhodotorula taiwanensis TaxID=741276 RepID=A0A2S5B7B3_9BASI|nr:hypothetical protein BMF94_4486 [Rhodotorula taiwanensis]